MGPTCDRCPAACCKWEAYVLANDDVPEEMLELKDLRVVMKRDPKTGYCVALDLDTMRCSIYEHRPKVCQQFRMGGEGCVKARSQMSPFVMRQYR